MSTVNYFLEVNIGLIFFYGVYVIYLRKENQFTISRIYLVSSMVLSLLLPLLHFHSDYSHQVVPTITTVIPTYWLPEISLQSPQPVEAYVSALSFWSAVNWLYRLVTGALVLLLVVRLVRVLAVIRSGTAYAWRSCHVTESETQHEIFSFFNFIFIGNGSNLSPAEKEKVLEHEWIHVKSFHSVDILFANILSILFWFNPVVFFYKKALVQLHEFEADARSVKETEVDTYCQLMAKVALGRAGFPLVNHFHNSLTLKRIIMMKTLKSKIKPWKLAAMAAAFPIVFFVVSCQDQVMTDVKTVAENSASATIIPPAVVSWIEGLKKDNPGKEYAVLELNEQGRVTAKKLLDENGMTGMSTFTYDNRNFLAIQKGRNADRLSEITVTGFDNSIHQFAQDMPQFPGGIDSLNSFIQRNLKYPRNSTVEGKVFVMFIVEQDGRISNPEVVKGIDPLLDKSAAEIVSRMPAWTPGKINGKTVRVKYVVPINFKLS